ncbi:MAG: transketolase C-terminal domain-containing protein [Candidatus Aminicenantales bacterium]
MAGKAIHAGRSVSASGPTVLLEPKLLSESWLEFMGSGGRPTVRYDVPEDGARGPVPQKWEPIAIGEAALRREGRDVSIVSIGVGVHRALQAAETLQKEGISAEVLDLRTISPLDKTSLCAAAAKTGRVLVVDEDYEGFGLSGEVAAVLAENGLSVKYERVCTRMTIPYARRLEDEVLPNVARICAAARKLV